MRRTRTISAFVVLGSLILSLLWAPPAYAEWFAGERRLTTDSSEQKAPAVYGTYVVYQDYRNGNWDIYLHDLSANTTKRLTRSTASQTAPSIYGTKVVYEDTRNGNRDIYLYDVAAGAERRLTRWSTADQLDPAINGTHIVYEDTRHGTKEIYLYDFSNNTEKRLTTSDSNNENPSISGNKVVYERHDDICLYDLSTGTESVIKSGHHLSPVIAGDKVAYLTWEGISGWNVWHPVWAYDLVTGVTVAVSGFTDECTGLSISGDRVAWVREVTDGQWSLCFKDLASGKVMSDIAAATGPTGISGLNIVYGSDRSDNRDIWALVPAYPALTISAPATIDFNGVATVTGRLSQTTGIAGRSVTLQTSTDSRTWTSRSTTTTAGDGTYTLCSPALTAARYVRVQHAGDNDYLAAASARKLVRPKIYFSTAPKTSVSTMRYGRTYSVWGYFLPKHNVGSTEIKIRAYHREKTSSGVYKYVSKKTYTAKVVTYTVSGGSIGLAKYQCSTVKLPLKGDWSFRAVHAADSKNATTYSDHRYVTVK